ncbi:MAG: hypothetical protein R3F11_10525 [Verrucomicrobiales bacterium]
MPRQGLPIMALLAAFLSPVAAPASPSKTDILPASPSGEDAARHVLRVRTTAYTHTEDDHIKYGAKSASGKPLRYGKVRSAAADWSRYPLGTQFRIDGDDCIYEVDDYGSALVGTGTIDLYRPNKAGINAWGVRNVKIEILRWGSLSDSLRILKPRASKASHVRKMVEGIRRKRANEGCAVF